MTTRNDIEQLFRGNYRTLLAFAVRTVSAHSAITLSATYTIGYGRKIRHADEISAGSSTSSAILR